MDIGANVTLNIEPQRQAPISDDPVKRLKTEAWLFKEWKTHHILHFSRE